MVLAITQRYGLSEGGSEQYFLDLEFKEIFEKLNILLSPVCTLTNIEEVLNICDGLVVTGSCIDINPKCYGEEATFEIHKKSQEIDNFDFEIIKRFDNANKPILGICRGIQAINVCYGGSLYQDIPNHKLDKAKRHNVKIENNSFLYDYYNQNTLSVNSLHHQALKDIATKFRITALSEDGIVEGIESDNIVAVQWHPEFMNDIKFFECFMDKVKKSKTNL